MHDYFKAEMDWWLDQEQKGKVEVWFSDKSSFHLNPNSMYGWQEKLKAAFKQAFLSANRAKVVNILGFMRTNNEGEFYEFAQATDTSIFIACVNAFIEKRAKRQKIFLILDRTTPHRNNRVDEEMKKWRERNVEVQFLPTYCSDLNYIEMFWKHIKHYCLNLTDWTDVETFKKTFIDILSEFEKEYRMEFKAH